METWKPVNVKCWEKYYRVSDMGNIVSIGRKHSKKWHSKDEPVKPRMTYRGYMKVGFCYRGFKKTMLVHRIVAMTFLPNNDFKKDVNHINCDKTDNRVVNLEWATRSQNIIHSYKKGLQKYAYTGKYARVS